MGRLSSELLPKFLSLELRVGLLPPRWHNGIQMRRGERHNRPSVIL